MTRVVLMPGLGADFQRIVGHLETHESAESTIRIESIVGALDVLTENPRIGRKASDGTRELISGRDASGYIASYRYDSGMDCVFVMAVRAQREVGYARESGEQQ